MFKSNMTVNVKWLFLGVPWDGLQCVIVLFPDHIHLLLKAMTMKIIDSNVLFQRIASV